MHVIHAVATADTVDLIGKNGAPILQGVTFNTPATGTVNPPVGTWDLAVVPSGGTVDAMIADVGVVEFQYWIAIYRCYCG